MGWHLLLTCVPTVQWAFTLSNPSDKRSYQHTAVTIGFTDKLTADRWHAKATEALLVHQQRDRPDLSAQSMTLPTRPSKGEPPPEAAPPACGTL